MEEVRTEGLGGSDDTGGTEDEGGIGIDSICGSDGMGRIVVRLCDPATSGSVAFW